MKMKMNMEKINGSDKIISWLSIFLSVLFFWYLRSSIVFVNLRGEARKAASSSWYFHTSIILNLWVILSSALTILPHFSSHYNEIIATALFFSMTIATVVALLSGRFMIRVLFYLILKFKLLVVQLLQRRGHGRGMFGDAIRLHTSSTIGYTTGQQFSMIWFHRPFRKLFKSSVLLSCALSMLYAHCWSQTLNAFKVTKEDDAGAVCRALFYPFSTSASHSHNLLQNQHVHDYDHEYPHQGVDEQTIWYFWTVGVIAMLIIFVQDEFTGQHYKQSISDTSNFTTDNYFDQAVHQYKIDTFGDDEDSNTSFDSDPPPHHHSNQFKFQKFFNRRLEAPKDILPMVPWYSLMAAESITDIFVQLKVFVGRFDARSMQPALQQSYNSFTANDTSKRYNLPNTTNANIAEIKRRYPGCVFDYSERKDCSNTDTVNTRMNTHHNNSNKDGFWFDFMADCGDGFNSSYQVARMLAQPTLNIQSKEGTKCKFQRGEFLVIGGDLAYPVPTEDSYEKRFFRTFEDALLPPPCFRRSKIARKKPDLPVRGWKNCFPDQDGSRTGADSDTDSGNAVDLISSYKGPCAFIIPGNHDWFDGLATFTRFILCRDWLGGWLMPQNRSYYALKLPKGWWLFGLDCAMSRDIDIDQYKFFADVAESAVGPSDAVIIVTHEPHWVTDFEAGRNGGELSERNIRELMKTHLAGKVRVRMAGDLHHYTRHIPHSSFSSSIITKRRRSYSFDNQMRNEKINEFIQPFIEENKPELIVAGGGGAFLHGTHTFEQEITLGESKVKYSRVCAYPNEKTSYYLSWLNMWHFRWRNWTFDLVWALSYLGIVASFFPLCGIFADYESFNPTYDPLLLPFWLLKKVGILFVRLLLSERVSLISASGLMFASIITQMADGKISLSAQLVWGFSHGICHIGSALSCLIFLQYMAEWLVEESIVIVSGNNSTSGLASSLYDEYSTHFSHVFKTFAKVNLNATEMISPPTETIWFDPFQQYFFQMLLQVWQFVSNLSLLKMTLNAFDLPGIIAKNHKEMCSILCSNETECLIEHDISKYLSIPRIVFAPYFGSISLFFVFLSVPIAGFVFGTWLALNLNMLKTHNDIGFSSLQLQHYKNFVKLHICENNGDLEVFAIGLNKVPSRWMKDSQWDGEKLTRLKIPSWEWARPSKWVPVKDSNNVYSPQVIDYTCIPKRRITSISSNLSSD